MNRLERHNRRILKMVGLDPTRMTEAQINRGVKALAGITRECCDPNANRRRPAAIEAWRKLVEEVGNVRLQDGQQGPPDSPLRTVSADSVVIALPLKQTSSRVTGLRRIVTLAVHLNTATVNSCNANG
jgi:hypothetical protein